MIYCIPLASSLSMENLTSLSFSEEEKVSVKVTAGLGGCGLGCLSVCIFTNIFNISRFISILSIYDGLLIILHLIDLTTI